jgi:hypothetical protein
MLPATRPMSVRKETDLTPKIELITQVREDDHELFLVRYRHPDPIWNGLWAFVYHDDPALDYAVDPQGYSRTDIWDPFGAYSHPCIPEDLWVAVEELITANA